jgi:EAL domain-containing protein (putative c-di-GMP-specific phosphodiesterase class I)/GGDEF domain-containing protein
LRRIDQSVRYAFQPIVSVHTGAAFGYEALLRGHEDAGFPSIGSLLDAAYTGPSAMEADYLLQEKAISAFGQFARDSGARLFYNLDNRLLNVPGFTLARATDFLRRHKLPASSLCLEISESHAMADPAQANRLLRGAGEGVLIAIDDFGTGYSGLQILCESHPSLIKIDRFFIDGLAQNQKKKVFIASIVNLAQTLGIKVVAEGVETEAEFRVCREIGCDLVQGYFIARPTVDLSWMRQTYEIVPSTNRADRRDPHSDTPSIRAHVERLPALSIMDGMNKVFEAFRQDKTSSFFPIVNLLDEPIGIIQETDLKEFVYSPFGKDLLTNRSTPYKLQRFLRPCRVFDVNTPLDRIIAGFALESTELAVLITEEGKYLGLLPAESMLRIVGQRNLLLARNENPLTKLPGNLSIADYIEQAFDDETAGWAFGYLDLDNFKPFNDAFGFRQGDRAILLFADLMRKHFVDGGIFLGHIGGDDFFLGMKNPDRSRIEAMIQALLDEFRASAATFYDMETRRVGSMRCRGRDGDEREFPLLSASCALLHLKRGARMSTSESVSSTLAHLKSGAKRAPKGLLTEELI